MGQLLLLAALACGDVRDARLPVVETTVDVADVNAVYSTDDGRIILWQAIFADIYLDGKEHVVGWRLLDHCGTPAKVNGRWRFLFIERDGTLKRVWCGAVRKTWYPEDWELLDRHELPLEERRELGKAP